jgi:hypothetical protein
MAITNGYATLDQFKEQMRLKVNDLVEDARAELSIAAASRQIDAHCGRRFWQDATVVDRQFYADNSRICLVDDISTLTGLVVKVDDDDDGTFETTLTITTNYIVRPLNAADMVPVHPFDELVLVDSNGAVSFPVHGTGRPGVQVTAKFGWPAIPDDVTKACLVQAGLLFKADDASLGAIQFADAGVALRMQNRLHPVAEALLEPYCKPRVG